MRTPQFWISVGWKYSSTSTLNPFTISTSVCPNTLCNRPHASKQPDGSVEPMGANAENNSIHNSIHAWSLRYSAFASVSTGFLSVDGALCTLPTNGKPYERGTESWVVEGF